MENKLVILLFEAVFYGFCFTSFISYCLSSIKSKKNISFNKIFFDYSIKIVRWVGVVYLIYKVIDYTYYYNLVMTDEDYISTKNRATGPYAWAYWMMILRPLVFSALTQLFWFKNLQKKSFINFFLIFLIFFIVLFSGSNFERFVIIVTSLHRNYLPSSWKFDEAWYLTPSLVILLFIERVIIYSFLVFTTWIISKKIKANKSKTANHKS